jgi:hypothetical protein
MSDFSQNDLVVVTREDEVTRGVVVGGSRFRVYGTAPTWAPEGNTLTSGTNTGDGGIKSVRAGLRAASVTIPAELIFRANDREWQDVLRDTYPSSEVTVAGNVTFAQAGTHEDGTTGPVITATAGTFDDMVDAGVEGCMLEISGGSVSAANKRPRAIKALKPDGSKIDLDPLYTSGASGQISEPLSAQSSVAATLRCGAPIRNRGIAAAGYRNFEFQSADQSSGYFEMVRGAKANTFKFGLDGKGLITQEFQYMAMDYDNPSATSQGSGVTANPFIDNDSMVAGEDLGYFLVGATAQLAAENLVSFSMDGNGNAQGVDDVAGSRNRTGVTVGDIDVTGNIKIYHEKTLMSVMVALGRNGNRVPVDWKVVDPKGNFYWGRLPKTLFEPGGAIPGAKGSKTDGTFNYKTQLGPNGIRTLIWQRFAATP